MKINASKLSGIRYQIQNLHIRISLKRIIFIQLYIPNVKNNPLVLFCAAFVNLNGYT